MEYEKRVRIFSLAFFAMAELVLFFPSILQELPAPELMGPLTCLLAVSSLIMVVFPPPPPQQEKRTELSRRDVRRLVKVKKVTSIACHGSCGLVYSRLFLRGDYFGRIVGRCPNCGGELYVRFIQAPAFKIVGV